MLTEVKVKKWGNSLGIIIPHDIIRSKTIKEGDTINVDLIDKKVSGFGFWKGKNLPKFKREPDEHEDLW